jgi:hypothetical protein
MDTNERHVLRYVLSWAPYGGPPADETFIEFGITTSVLRERFSRIVNRELTETGARSYEDRLLIAEARAYELRPRARHDW